MIVNNDACEAYVELAIEREELISGQNMQCEKMTMSNTSNEMCGENGIIKQGGPY